MSLSRLVLSRQDGETIHIGDNIIIDVRRDPQRPKFIKVGITAPRDMKILRSELMPQGESMPTLN